MFAYERPSDLTTAVPAPPHLASAYTSTPTVHGYKTSLSPDDIIDLMSAPAVVAATVAAPAVTAHSAEAGEEDVPMYGGDDE